MPDSVRVGSRTPKGYYRSQFDELWQRYLVTEEGNETQQRNSPDGMGISSTFLSATLDADVAVQKSGKPGGNGHCCGVAVQKQGQGLEGVNGQHCDHCQRPGAEADPLLDVFDGERGTHLHRACLGVWEPSKRHQHRKDLTMIDDMSVEQWLAIRKEEGLKIDSETAEVEWWYARVLDPYGVYPELEESCVGREYFARAPGSDIWVCFGDLPEKTSEVLWKKYGRASLETRARNSY